MGKHKRKRRHDDDEEELFSLFKKFSRRMREKSISSDNEEEAPPSAAVLVSEASAEISEPPEAEPTEPTELTVPTEDIDIVTDLVLDEETLNILGEDPQEVTYGPPLHKDIANRWHHIVTNGLEKEKKTEILKRNQMPGNCTFLEAPKTNPEIKAAVSEQVLKRDRILEQQQNSLGQATASIGRALDILIKNKECKEATKILSDAGRLLCELYHTESVSRRHLLQFALNKDTKDIVAQTNIGKYIFGDSLNEDLKAAKAINKTGTEIKYAQPHKPPKNNTLNSRGPPRKYLPQHVPSAGRQIIRPRSAAHRWPGPQRWPAPQRWAAPQLKGPPHRKS